MFCDILIIVTPIIELYQINTIIYLNNYNSIYFFGTNKLNPLFLPTSYYYYYYNANACLKLISLTPFINKN